MFRRPFSNNLWPPPSQTPKELRNRAKSNLPGVKSTPPKGIGAMPYLFVLGGVEGAAFVGAAPPPASGDWLQPVNSVHNAKPNSTIRVDILFIVAVGFMKTAVRARKIFGLKFLPNQSFSSPHDAFRQLPK
jgi:hypothetical protein